MIACTLGAGCIGTSNDNSIDIPFVDTTNTKFSINDIEKMAKEGSDKYNIMEGYHESYYRIFEITEESFCFPLWPNDENDNGIYSTHIFNTDFKDYVIKDNVIILSHEQSFFIVLDEDKEPYSVVISEKGEIFDKVAGIIYVDAQNFNYIKETISIVY